VMIDGDGKGDDTIESTAGLAFWTNLIEPGNDGAKWVPARDLVSGAWLRTSSGTWVQATALTAETRLVNTYNLSVSQTHTYYVQTATADALVHNCDNSHLADLPIHEKPTRFYAKASEMENRSMGNPSTPEQMNGSASVGHRGVANLSNDDLLRFGGPNGRDPITGYREFAPGDDVNFPGSILHIIDGNNRTEEIMNRVRDGRIHPDTLVEIMIGGT